jgi:hypothetical protein
MDTTQLKPLKFRGLDSFIIRVYTLTNWVGMHVLVLQKSLGMLKKITQGQFGDNRVAINTDGSLSFLLMSLAATGPYSLELISRTILAK